MSASSTFSATLYSIVERVIISGQISHQEHLQLTSAILADQTVTANERRQINRVLDYIQTGRLKIVH
ncbi:MAG: hypothetical protein HC881_05680 [Leptolyngbyaceae cyanobacterium SL_7_1]|nr:hypothetical protein [Leptolyngbyaceae cyanobacterium SL_7_1]